MDVTQALTAVAKLINAVRNNITSFYSTRSLSEVTKLTRVEPLTIVSKDCLNLDYMPDITNSLLSIFAGYYLQAIAMLTKVNDVEVVKILDKLNPDRDETGFLLMDSVAKESIKHLVLESYKHRLPSFSSIALEATQDEGKYLNEVTNLSVGKLINVDISYSNDDGDDKPKKVTLPVNVRLMASVIPNSTITHLLTHKTEDIGLVERYHAWRSGRISFIKDLIFCQDLIDESKKATIGDETGTMQEIMRRVSNSKKYGLITKNPSLVSASNLFVISEEIARDIESRLGGKLSNPRVRQKAFDNTYAMIIAVVDRDYERVTFYTRGISAATDVSIREIKAANKGKGIDIADVLKSMQMSNPVSF